MRIKLRPAAERGFLHGIRVNSQHTSPLMDGGVDEEAAAAAAALLMVVDVIEELTRVSSRVAKRKKKNLCH